MAKKRKAKLGDNVEAWLTSGRADTIADYAARGRIHHGLSDKRLLEAWVASFVKMADDYTDLDARALHEDFHCELELRKLDPPHDRVRDAQKRYIAAALDVFKKMQTDDPERFESVAERIDADVQAFEERLKKPKH